jgi:uncharacterized protein YndB with AHSA1/START domain
MNKNEYIARIESKFNAPIEKVWKALTDPAIIKQYFFGSDVKSDWQEGSPITWSGIWNDKPYEDKGTILKVEAPRYLEYNHYSPLTGEPDVPENYHTLTYTLREHEGHTHFILTQDSNKSAEERDHSQQMWQQMMEGLRRVVES